MKTVTTSNLFYNNNDLYNDGRTYDGIYPEKNDIENPFMNGSSQAVEINLTKHSTTTFPIVAATTQIHPNSETDQYYSNRN